MEPQDYVGRFILLRRHQLPKTPQYIDPAGYRVTGLRSKRQLLLEPLHESCGKRAWTRVGDHIACAFKKEASYNLARQVLLTAQDDIDVRATQAAERLQLIAKGEK